MMKRNVIGKGPKDLKKTLRRLMKYLGFHKLALAAVAVMVVISAMANIMGTYLLKPVIQQFIEPGDLPGLGGKCPHSTLLRSVSPCICTGQRHGKRR